MILDYRAYQRGNRLRRGTLRHSFNRCATNSPALITQRIEQRRCVERLIVTDGLSSIPPRRLITFSQTRRELALTLQSLCNILNSDDEPDNRITVTQRRDRHSLLHLLEMFRRINWGTRDQIMMKGRGKNLDYTFTNRSLEAFQQPALFEIRQQRSQILTCGRFLTDTRKPRERRIPNSNHEISICCENADLRHPCSSAAGLLARLRLGFSAPLPPIMLSMISPSCRARSASPDVLVNVALTPSALRFVIRRSSLTSLRSLSAASRWLRFAFVTRSASFETFATATVISCDVRDCSRIAFVT